MRIAILGAECTGKTELASALTLALAVPPAQCCWVAEYLREWCAARGRTPLAHEQRSIAMEQARRIDNAIAIATADFVIADTTALMAAVYSDVLFDEPSLYAFALEHHRAFDLTLLMGLDLPWVADGLQRDGPAAQAQVDARLRQTLAAHSVNYAVVYGTGTSRTDQALQAIDHQRQWPPGPSATHQTAWKWVCDHCSDTDCEHRLFSQLLLARASNTGQPIE